MLVVAPYETIVAVAADHHLAAEILHQLRTVGFPDPEFLGHDPADGGVIRILVRVDGPAERSYACDLVRDAGGEVEPGRRETGTRSSLAMTMTLDRAVA
ncbi:MAG: hypothetical protein H0X38_11960 [Planctomycetes bacterium]|nr:hypothetical protein [Planctomycetota bacterium]